MSNNDITEKNLAQEAVCLGKKVNHANCVKWKMYMAVDKLCAPNKIIEETLKGKNDKKKS